MAHEKAQTMAVNTITYARTICMRLILRVYSKYESSTLYEFS